MLHEIEIKYLKEHGQDGNPDFLPKINMIFRRNPSIKKMTYNEPEANEITIIFYTEDGTPPF